MSLPKLSVVSALSFALRRLWRHRSLVASLTIGLVLAVALAVAVPLYSDGVNYNLLNAALSRAAAESRRPPFSFIYHYVGSWHTPLDLDQYNPADAFIRDQVPGLIGLPSRGLTRYVSTDSLQLFPQGRRIQRSRRLEVVRLAFITGFLDPGASAPIQLIEGRLPNPVTESGEPIEALASLALANDTGLQAGTTYQVYRAGAAGQEAFQTEVVITGIWTPADPAAEFWFYPPESFDKRLIVPEETLLGPVAETLPKPVNEAVWRIAFDGGQVRSEEVPGLIGRIEETQTQVNALLPNTDLEASPVQALRGYYANAQSLTGLLFIFSAPVLGLTFYFLGLVAAMLVRVQRNEIAVLRSRGASRGWIAGMYGIEWSLLGLFALLCGPLLALSLALLVGRTQSFLDFSNPAELPLRLTPNALWLGLAAVGLALLFSLVPVWQASRDTIISYKQERARARRRPLWQRMYLDVLLLLPAVYGLYTLRAEGRLQVFGRSLGANNPFENPVLFLLPTLFICALSLLLLRLLPRLLDGLAWLSARLPDTVPVLALRQLARSTGDHLGPLMLLVLTLSLAGFVSSMAHTLDRHLADGVYYAAGADLNLVEGGEYTGEAPAGSGAPGLPGALPQAPGGAGSEEPAVWNFLPVTDHLALPGVQAAARLGRFESTLRAAGRSANGRLVGLDRMDFPAVAFFRPDFASEPLVSLMNRLAYDPAALLVDRGTWERFHLNTGDTVQLDIRIPTGERQPISFKVVGLLDYFPTLYPEEGPFFIANLEYIFEVFGGLLPYDVWLKTAPGADTGAIIRGINNLGVAVVRAQDARAGLAQVLAAPNRQGVLGLLSVGFLSASLLTVIGFLLYALFSFRERFVQLGVLRAIGLSTRQMSAALAIEQLLLLLTGLLAGTGIAVLTAYLFVPHLPVTFGSHPGTPPYVVEIAWDDITRVYLVFGLMLLVGIGSTLWSLRRMKIFQAVKLGEVV
jgi:putative ABC transport system permease protein